MKSAAAILILFVLTCCELVTEIDIPESPPLAVVNSIFNSDSTWLVNISASTHILSNSGFKVENAKVLLTDETGQQIELVESDPFDTTTHFPSAIGQVRGAVYRGNTNPQPGMTYHIEVRGSNVATATATARTPIAAELLDAKIDSAHSIAFSDDVLGLAIPIEFTIEDPPGIPDTYYPRMFRVFEYKRYNPNTGDTVINRFQQFIQLAKDLPGSDFSDSGDNLEGFSDGLFDGKRHRVKLYIINYGIGVPGGKTISLRLYLNHADEVYSRYFSSLQLQDNARNNPFAQPVQVYSNVEGGLGIFSGSASSYWEFVK